MTATTFTRPIRVGARLVIVALVGSLLTVVTTGAARPTAAHADTVQQPTFHCGPHSPWSTFFLFQDRDEVKLTSTPANDDSYADPAGPVSATDPKFFAPGTSPFLGGPDNRTWTVPASDGVRANDDLSNTHDPLDVQLATAPSHAKNFTFGVDGSFSWTPADGWLGGDSFTYYTVVGDQCVDSAVVRIAAATRERLVDDTYTVPNNATFHSDLALCFNSEPKLIGQFGSGCGVAKNDLASHPIDGFFTVPDLNHGAGPGFPLTTTAGGVLTLQENGSFTYVPPAGFVGDDVLYYEEFGAIGSHRGESYTTLPGGGIVPFQDAARVTLHVVAASSPAPVQPDFFVTDEDSPITVSGTNLLANDAQGVGPIIGLNNSTASSIRSEHGTLAVAWFQNCLPGFGCQVTGLNSVTYTPDHNFNGNDSFVYTGAGNGLPGIVTISVRPVYDRPTATNDFVPVANHTSVSLDLTANDDDPDGGMLKSQLTITPLSNIPQQGTLVDNGDGHVTFQANGNGFGQYLVEIPTVESNYTVQETLAFFVSPNTATDDSYSTDEDTPLAVAAPGVLANDDGDTVPTKASDPQHGSVVFNPDGSFTYQPATNYNGEDSFTYGNGGKTGTVHLTVNPVGDAPAVVLNTYCKAAPGSTCPLADYDNRGNLNEGDSARLRGAIVDPEQTPGTLTVAWGDGKTTSVNYPCLPGTPSCPFTTTATWGSPCGFFPCGDSYLFFEFRHTYANNPPGAAPTFAIHASADSLDGLSGAADETAVVKDVAPTVTLAPECSPGSVCIGNFSSLTNFKGRNVTLAGRLSDPGTDATGSLFITWGDGSGTLVFLDCNGGICLSTPLQSTVCLTPSPSCGYFAITHTYDNDATYDIGVSVGADGQGGSASTTAKVLVDTSPPTASPTVAPAPNGAGWHKGDAQVTWNWSDTGGAGIDPNNCAMSSTSSGEGTQTLNASCTDKAGNLGQASFTVKVDAHGPTAAPAVAPTPNDAGWNNTDAKVIWNWSDTGGSGIDLTTCPASTPSSGEGVQSLHGACADVAGNTATASYDVRVDKHPPTASPSIAPVPNAAGWNSGGATVNWNWSDTGGSGIDASACTTSSSSSGEGSQTLTATCTDVAGNVGSASKVVKVDTHEPTAAPTVSAAPNAAGWNNTNVTVTWHWTDTGGSAVDATKCTTSSATSADGVQTVNATCTDVAGNVGHASYDLKIDTTAPGLAPVVSPNPVLLGGLATATPNPTDGLSGVKTSSCASVSTATLGQQSVSCTATDNAGNTATKSATYVVGVAVTNVTPAVRMKYSPKSALPVTFQLRGANGQTIAQTLATQLSKGCNATVTLGTLAPACANYSATTDLFQATVKGSASWKPGMVVPITVNVAIGGVIVGTGSSSITIG